MKQGERDLLILLNESRYTASEMERQASLISELLSEAERMERQQRVAEVLDLNKGKVLRKPQEVSRVLQKTFHKPFCFLFFKN